MSCEVGEFIRNFQIRTVLSSAIAILSVGWLAIALASLKKPKKPNTHTQKKKHPTTTTTKQQQQQQPTNKHTNKQTNKTKQTSPAPDHFLRYIVPIDKHV